MLKTFYGIDQNGKLWLFGYSGAEPSGFITQAILLSGERRQALEASNTLEVTWDEGSSCTTRFELSLPDR